MFKTTWASRFIAAVTTILLVLSSVRQTLGQTTNSSSSSATTTSTTTSIIDGGTSRSSNFSPDTICPLLPDGTKIKDPRYCNVYIVCQNDTSTSYSCGQQFFDRDTGECVDPATIDCLSSNPCAKKPTGFVADPYSCSNYYYCSNGVGTLGQCSTGLNYNPDTNNCVRNFSCEITMLPEDYCNIVPEGVFIKVPGSCTEYQLCWRTELLNGTCPDGFYYDAYRGGCDYPSNVECVEHNSQLPNIPEDVKCSEAGVFISDGVTCNGYFYCSSIGEGEFGMRHGNCPVDRFFDPADGGQCVPRTDIVCEHNRCVTLGMDFIQMASNTGDGCRGFSLCQNGQTIGQASCPSGEYFDEWSQLCVDHVIDYVACAGDGDNSADGSSSTSTSTTTPTVTAEPESTINTNSEVAEKLLALPQRILTPVPVPRLT
ncbi:peritrophin-44-like [Musca domestica]|uniref:Peritrophin-44-like n=1 Tax=Musca domestica TaxID=7370 RepID=A0A9J7D5B9_MUSDO|nr:peritrophin-44-like [Musca domestica]